MHTSKHGTQSTVPEKAVPKKTISTSTVANISDDVLAESPLSSTTSNAANNTATNPADDVLEDDSTDPGTFYVETVTDEDGSTHVTGPAKKKSKKHCPSKIKKFCKGVKSTWNAIPRWIRSFIMLAILAAILFVLYERTPFLKDCLLYTSDAADDQSTV